MTSVPVRSPGRLPRLLAILALTVLAAALIAPAAARSVVATAIRPDSVTRMTLDLDATYDVNLAVRYGDRAVRLDSIATITNVSGGAIDRIELNTVAAKLGAMSLDRVSVDNRLVTATVSDQTIVVPLGGLLQPGATTRVRVIYHATLRTGTAGSDWFFTRANGVIDLYRAIPWVSLRHPFGRPNQGDPFVTPTSRQVTLTLRTDRPMTAALNAMRTSVSADGRIQGFRAQNVRDLPIALSPDFRVSRSTLGSTEILVYTRAGGPAADLMADARRSLQRIAPLLGPYPWPRFIVVGSSGGYPMEGPGTIWMPPGIAPRDLPYLVAHETAHQWTPGLVGNDQWAEPFADEAVADMVARTVVDLHRGSACPTQRLDLPITSYSGACYYEVIYIQGGNWLNALRVRMGDGVYWRALRSYLTEHRFGLAGTRTLLDTLDGATPVDVAALARPRFPGLY
jgi:hypothetical protein